MTNETEPRVVSVEDAAIMLACSRSTIYGLMKSGDLFNIKVGKLRRIPVEGIEAFMRGEAYNPNADCSPHSHADTTTWPPTPSMLELDS